MPVAVAFSALLAVAVLISGRAERSVLSTTVLFLLGGIALGRAGLEWEPVPGAIAGGLSEHLSEIALFAVLFTDGLRLSARDLRSSWSLPGRTLLIGLPITLAAVTVAGHAFLGLSWLGALLLGAVLAPTDPVLAEAIVGRPSIPSAVRHTLNVESGLNDGLVLPLVIALLAVASPSRERRASGKRALPP